jgi:hypothetical protein
MDPRQMTIRDAEEGVMSQSSWLSARARSATASVSDAAVRDLAASRREAAALRRENDRLRAQLGISVEPPRTSSPARAGERPPGPLWCRRCGLRIDGPTAARDQVLVLAACCPECDGPLVAVQVARDPSSDPSRYLG